MPTYNRAAKLPAVIDAALRSSTHRELIVVVDGCDDGSMAMLEALARTDARLRPMFIENRGGAGARQAGLEQATSEIVIFVDDDVALDPGAVDGHLVHHARHPNAMVVGYMPIVATHHAGASAFASHLYNEEYERLCALYEADPSTILTNLWGGNISVRRDAALAVGWWHPGMGRLRHHDRDFGLRCQQHGVVGVFDRSVRAAHLHERSLPDFREDSRSQGAARAALASLHPDTVEGVRIDAFAEGLPQPLRVAVKASRHPRVHRLLGSVLVAGLHVSAPRPLRRVQVQLGRLLRRIDQQAGAIDEAMKRRSD
jgi:glycosyltransferase involved in cell wall biosynthesis